MTSVNKVSAPLYDLHAIQADIHTWYTLQYCMFAPKMCLQDGKALRLMSSRPSKVSALSNV